LFVIGLSYGHMTTAAGVFDANALIDAVQLVDSVLAQPGSWLNLEFEPLEDDDAPQESELFKFLAARGPANPLATIVARTEGRRPRPPQVGIQHQAGTKAAHQLRDAQLTLPEGARVTQDHPRRGLVVRWPEEADTAVLVGWLFPAMRVLGRHRATNNILYSIMTTD